MRRLAGWRRVVASGLLAAGQAGCGEGTGPAPPPGPIKIAPTLPRLHRQRSLAEWTALAQASDPALRAEAPWALAELLTDPAQLSPLLGRLLADAAADVRYAALVAVGRVALDLGPEVSRACVAQLAAPEPGLALAARQTVGALGERAVDALAEVVRTGEEEQALAAARALGALGPKGVAGADALIAGTGRSMSMALECARALERLGMAAAGALAQALPGTSPEQAGHLLGVAARWVGRVPALLPPMVAALSREEPEVQQAARAALAGVGEPALAALDAAAQDAGSTAGARERSRLVAEQIRASLPPR